MTKPPSEVRHASKRIYKHMGAPSSPRLALSSGLSRAAPTWETGRHGEGSLGMSSSGKARRFAGCFFWVLVCRGSTFPTHEGYGKRCPYTYNPTVIEVLMNLQVVVPGMVEVI